MKTTDYVKRNEVISTIERIMWEEQGEGFINLTHYARSLHDAIKSMDAVDAAPVVHAEWCRRSMNGVVIGYRCSECFKTNDAASSYCPNCGASMDLEEQW